MALKVTLLLLGLAPMAFAQKTDSIPKPTTLENVDVIMLHRNDSLMRAPASVWVLRPADLQRNNHSDISAAINIASGVLMQSSNIGTSRISIRGIGARTPYGTNKIRAFYGNIPLTSGNSETIIDDIDLENLGGTEIIKGPLSTLYGAGLGGAILLKPKLPAKSGNTASLSTVYGSFGLVKNSVAFNHSSASSSLNLSYHKLQTAGWRDNSAYIREGITLAGGLFRTARGKLTYFGNYTWLKSYLPSSIDQKTFDQMPQKAAPTWAAAQGYKQYESVLGGLDYNWKLTDRIQNSTSVFINYKDNYEPRPFDILGQYTFGYGARTQFSSDFKIASWQSGAHVGFEYFKDNYSGRTTENLYQDNNGNGSLEGNWLTAEQQHRQWLNGFAQWRIWRKHWEFQAGVNVNQTRFDLNTKFPSANSQTYNYEVIWSPQASVLFRPTQSHTLYVSASRGFSLPSTEETLSENGTVNPNIRPETGINLELGGKFYFFDRKFYCELTGYRMQVSDLLVARRVDDDRYVGVNAGETLHQGFEFSARYKGKIGTVMLQPYVSGSIGDYRFEDFTDRSKDYSGNALTGVPRRKFNTGVRADWKQWFILCDGQYVAEMPLNDANEGFSDSYALINLKAGYRLAIMQMLNARFDVGVNNVSNELYASLILPNATAFGGASPRYFYPGLPVNYYANISLEYYF